MDFYEEWNKSLADIEENKKYIKKFLSKDEESMKVFKDGTVEQLVTVCKFLLKIPIRSFIYCIDTDVECTPDMIVQFSNLDHALIEVPRILKFSESPLTFSQLGRIIVKAKEDSACKKYGENHSKLAEELSMVFFEKHRTTFIQNTAFGNFCVDLSDHDRTELVKRLILRNLFIQKIIFYAKNGFASYMDLALPILSESTAIRRKSNVRQLIYLVLKDHNLWNNIVW